MSVIGLGSMGATIAKLLHDKGLNTEFSDLANRLLQRAYAAGLDNEELAALIKVMRK